MGQLGGALHSEVEEPHPQPELAAREDGEDTSRTRIMELEEALAEAEGEWRMAYERAQERQLVLLQRLK